MALTEVEKLALNQYVDRCIAAQFGKPRRSDIVAITVEAVLEWLEKHKGGKSVH